MNATRVGAGPRTRTDTYLCHRCGAERPRRGDRDTCSDCRSVLQFEARERKS